MLKGVIQRMFGREPEHSVNLLQQISKRAEHLTREEQAKSFVAIRRIEGALKSRDSRVLFGRRGTGKTHILSFVASTARDSGDIAVVLDMRTLGSNNSIFSDQSVDPSVRATTLIRDLISALSESFLETYTDPKSPFRGSGLDKAIEKFADCVKSVVATNIVETRVKGATSDSAALTGETGVEISAIGGGARAKVATALEQKDEREIETLTKGVPKLSINLGEASKALNDIAASFQNRIWILLDEWSSLPENLQPYLADFVRRAILPVQNITVQIAAIEFRSKFRVDFEDSRIGFEVGSDIAADINLDDYFVYDVNAEASLEFFQKLLFRHLQAISGDNGLFEKNETEMLNAVFSQERVFAELVRASEGVPRDFINILQLAAMRSDQTKLSMNEVRAAAKDWFERDKQRNLDNNQRAQALLEWIRDTVIDGKKARAFMLETDASDGAIEFLFDERMLHIAKRSYSAKDKPGTRYRVWKVDYGCYVDLINTTKNPTEFLFEGLGMTDAGEIVVPEDDYRAVRRAVLNLEDFNESYGVASSIA